MNSVEVSEQNPTRTCGNIFVRVVLRFRSLNLRLYSWVVLLGLGRDVRRRVFNHPTHLVWLKSAIINTNIN